MVDFAALSTPARSRIAVLGFGILALAACSSADKAPDTAAAIGSASAPSGKSMGASDSMAGMQKGKTMDGMAGMEMTGDADRDFLRMMSDHHKGMILMAHMTKDRREGGSSVADARKLDAAQDAELDRMMTMLEKDYKDAYAAKVMPDNQAMADELKGKSGADYERTFYQNVIKHHEQAIRMVDAYLPKSKSAAVKQMAEKMKADQAKEVAEFQKKIGAMK